MPSRVQEKSQSMLESLQMIETKRVGREERMMRAANEVDVTTMPIGDIMQRNVVTVDLDDTLSHVRQVCDQHRFHQTIVTDDRRVVGIVSYSDVLRNLSPFAGKKWSARQQDEWTLNLKVHQIMVRQLVSATEEMQLAEAAELMLRHGIASLPVLSPKRHLRGIVTWKDLIRTLFGIEAMGSAAVNEA